MSNLTVNHLCGKMFYLAEYVQSLGNNGQPINKTITDTYFEKFVNSPVSVFSHIDRSIQISLKKVKRSKPGLAVILEKEYGAIITQIGTMPNKRTSTEKAEIIIGYHSRKEERYTKKIEESIPAE